MYKQSDDMSNHVKLKWKPVLISLGMKQSIELLEPLHAEEASWADLQGDGGGAVGAKIVKIMHTVDSHCLS